MKLLSKFLPGIVFMLFFLSILSGQNSRKGIPIVFQTGEYEKGYDQIVHNYSTMLLTVCHDDLSKSFDVWTEFLKELEAYAADENFDLKGAKLWINVFWDKSGAIDHIVFYPKPNARNLDYKALEPILVSFAKQYQLPISHKEKFSHYGSANFPIVPRVLSGSIKQ